MEINTKTETKTGNTGNAQCGSMSPTKLPGILLTPGTATTRRKTVSFGTEVSNNDDQDAARDVAQKNKQNLSTQKQESSYKASRKTPLTRTLELARETKARNSGFEVNRGSLRSQQLIDLGQDIQDVEGETTKQPSTTKTGTSQASNQELLQELISGDEFDGDMTMDLNEPHSQSGKYWKSEYEQYHEQAKAEMQKLLKYKQLAKSYAKKKDAETLVLTEKLKEEQRRITAMEDRISKLSAQIVTPGFVGHEGECSELVKDLAKQTALALQYKAQVEEFRVEEERKKAQASASEGGRFVSSRTEESLTDTRRGLRTTPEQLRDLAPLRPEVKDLRQALLTLEKSNSKLQEDNTKLTRHLLHAESCLEKEEDKSKKLLQATEEQLQKKVEAYKSLQQDYNTLKEKAKAQRGNAEHLLRKRHEQVVGLRRELASVRRELVDQEHQNPLQKKPLGDEQGVARHRNQITLVEDKSGKRPEEMTEVQESMPHQARKQFDPVAKLHHSSSIANSHDSLIPISSRPHYTPSKSPESFRQTHVELPGKRSTTQTSHSALSEIANNAKTERLPSEKAGPVRHTPLSNRNSNMSPEAPAVELPSPEPSLSHITGRMMHERKFQPSPRPSMFNFTSSPPNPGICRPGTEDEVPGRRSAGNFAGQRQVNVASSQLPSVEGSRTRSTLPPERAAAARARLERKNADKKRAQALGAEKENILN
jgi:hypothetical protein